MKVSKGRTETTGVQSAERNVLSLPPPVCQLKHHPRHPFAFHLFGFTTFSFSLRRRPGPTVS